VSLRVVIDLNVCSGTSNCVEDAPEAYELNERGLAMLRPGRHSDEVLLRGARTCPVEAISVYDTETGKKIYP
jgi:ferredoxin